MGETPCSTTTLRRAAFTAWAQPSETGASAYSETLPRVRESAGIARHLVRHALEVWHLDDLTEPAALVITELVANAVDHARGDSVRVTITRLGDDGVRIGVVDKSRVAPKPRRPAPDEVGGRGILLIEHMAKLWGTDLMPWGKRVWAVLGS